MKRIKDQILQEVRKKKRLTSSDLMRKFGVSRQAIHRHLQALIQEGFILKFGSSRMTTSYVLNTEEGRAKIFGRPRQFRRKIGVEGTTEDRIFSEVESQAMLLNGLSKNARDNLQYAFTEMVNNALDHSQSVSIDIKVNTDAMRCFFEVRDRGVGVFANVQQKLGLVSELEALEDIIKGKQTTEPDRHSGEGIFFTSKIVERFILASHKKMLTIDNRIDDLFVEDVRFLKGTKVCCEIDIDSARKLSDLFAQYTGETFSFDRTRVTVKLFEAGESYVSRSQAKRLLHSLERFHTITLDFSGVSTVGQGFADEIFRVFQNAHSEIRILPINMNENVSFMIRRAKS